VLAEGAFFKGKVEMTGKPAAAAGASVPVAAAAPAKKETGA